MIQPPNQERAKLFLEDISTLGYDDDDIMECVDTFSLIERGDEWDTIIRNRVKECFDLDFDSPFHAREYEFAEEYDYQRRKLILEWLQQPDVQVPDNVLEVLEIEVRYG